MKIQLQASRWCALLLVLLSHTSFAQPQEEPPLYVSDIALESVEEFQALLERAEALVLAGASLPAASEPQVAFVLHGPVLRQLVRKNYLDNKRLVDLAAAMSALEFIEIKACRTWINRSGLDPAQFQPFVEMVDYGPSTVRELVRTQGRVYF